MYQCVLLPRCAIFGFSRVNNTVGRKRVIFTDVSNFLVISQISHFTYPGLSYQVKEVKPITNQRASGRCWIFAFLNAIRQKFVQHFNLEDFEFSQQYLYFWDRIERSYFFINVYEELARKGEKPDGRLMMFLLSNPLNDGGQWDMLINLVEKYGLIPKEVWPEAFTAGRSMRLRKIMNYKVWKGFVEFILSLLLFFK